MNASAISMAAMMLVTSAFAQFTQMGLARGERSTQPTERGAIQGSVDTHGRADKDLQVLLIDSSGNEAATADVSTNGTFFFSSVARGEYELRLMERGRTVCERSVTFDGMVQRVDLDLPAGGRPSGGEIVSVAELRHKLPAEALKEAQKGEVSLRKKKSEEAIDHFERAVEIDPDFTAVHQELANLYLLKHDDMRAVGHLQTVLKARPSSAPNWANLSAAELRRGRVNEAEAAARRTLVLEPANAVGRYILGISLAFQDKDTDKAISYLRATFTQFPRGHMAVAKILAAHGDLTGARAELEAYVDLNPRENNATVKAWLERLSKPVITANSVAAVSK
jgi:hypothetical protein